MRALLAFVLISLPLSSAPAEDANEEMRRAISKKAAGIIEVVEELRGLEFKQEVDLAPMTREEFLEFLRETAEEELPAAESERISAAWAALGLIPEGFDILEGLLGLLGQGVMGFYDQDTKKLFVLSDAPLTGYSELIIAHELLHALEDQHFDLKKLLDGAEALGDDDAVFALRGLVEGSASRLHEEYVEHVGLNMMTMQMGMMEEMQRMMAMPPLPVILQRDTNLPYTRGPIFVAKVLEKRGGWPAIDELYENPPRSSEQILHPEKLGEDLPQKIFLPDLGSLLGEGWEELEVNTLGEMGVAAWIDSLKGRKESMMQAQMSRGTSKVSKGWDGDRYGAWRNLQSGEVAVVAVSVWDTFDDAEELRVSVNRYAGKRFDHIVREDERVMVASGFAEGVEEDVLLLLSQCKAIQESR